MDEHEAPAPSSSGERPFNPTRELGWARPSRIIVADDDPDMRRLIALALSDDGHEVIEARDGVELSDALGSELPHASGRRPSDLVRAFLLHPKSSARLPAGQSAADLVISDFRMPGVTGLSVLAGLRDCGGQTPFILMTAFGSTELKDSAIQFGATAYFEKQDGIPQLRRTVFELLR